MAKLDYPELIPNDRHPSGEQRNRSYLTDYYQRMGQWLDAAYEEANALEQSVPELQGIQNSIDYLGGLQWGKQQMPSYRAKPVSNEIMSMFWETIGLLTDVKPMFQISTFGNGGDFSKTEQVLNRLGKGWAKTTKFERKLAFVTMFGMMTTAPAKVYWNPFAHGYSGDPEDGDISFEYCRPSNLKRLGAMTDDLQDDECVIYCRTRTIDWIRRAFPAMGKLVQPEQRVSKYSNEGTSPIQFAPHFYPVLSGGMRRMMDMPMGNPIHTIYPTAEVREYWKKDDSINESHVDVWMGPKDQPWGYWVKPGQKLYPRGRLIIRCNKVTLYDEPNPYFHRKFPFALLGLYQVPWQQYALSVMQPWMSQQDILNQIMAGILQTVKKAVNPPLLAAKSAISPEALRAIDSSKPNLKITYSQNAPQPPTWGQPPNLPGYVFQSYGNILQSMRRTSGADVADAASAKRQVPGADTLDRMTFSRTTPIRLMGRNMEDFVDEVGNLWTADALQFYDAAHRTSLLGASGLTKEDLDERAGVMIPDGVKPESYVRMFKYECDKGTLLNVQRQDRVQISFALRKNHDLSRKKLFEELDWNINLQENDAELAQEAEAMMKAQAAAGIKPGEHKHK